MIAAIAARTQSAPSPRATAVNAVLATSGGLVGVFVTSALAPRLHVALGVTEARLGLIVAVFFATSSLSSPLFGRLVDRAGSVRAMRAALLLATGCLVWIGLGVHGWIGLAVTLAVAGLANGAIQPASNRYIGLLIRRSRQGAAFGVKQSAIPVAMLIGGIFVPVAARGIGWRAIYLVLAAGVLVVAIALRRPSPPSRVGVSANHRPTLDSAATPSLRPLLVLATGWGLASAGSNALGAFFILAAIRSGFSPLLAGSLAVVGALASMTVRVAAGFLADRQAGSGLMVVAAMCAVGAVGMALPATEHPWAFAAATILGYGLGSGWGGLFSYAIVTTHPAKPGRATGITQAGASAGSCLGPLGFGVLAATLGYVWAWSAVTITMVAAAITVLVGREMLRR